MSLRAVLLPSIMCCLAFGQQSPPLTITTTSIPLGTVGLAYDATIFAAGSQPPYSWSLSGGTSLPAGLTLAPCSGCSGDNTAAFITGTPTAVGATSFYVRVSGGLEVVAQALTLTVVASKPAISSLSPNPVIVGEYGVSLVVSGSGFVVGSTVQWNGTSLVTTYVSTTQLTATVQQNLIAGAGTAQHR